MADVAPQSFIDPKVLAQIGDLALLARSVVDGFLHGLHRSSRAGLSLDFAEHRPYQPGDDLRRIDWRVYGRTDRFYLKTYEADTNADVVFALDASASMDYGSGGRHQVRLRPLSDRVAGVAGAAAGRSRRPGDHRRRHARHRAAVDAAPATDPAHTGPREGDGAAARFPRCSSGWRRCADRAGHRGAGVGLLRGARRCCGASLGGMRSRGNDVIVFHVIDPAERDLPWTAPGNFEDAETGARMPLRPDDLRKQYREIFDAHRAALLREFGRERIDYAAIETDQPLDAALRTFLDLRLMGSRVR